jgi:hypothetical protein
MKPQTPDFRFMSVLYYQAEALRRVLRQEEGVRLVEISQRRDFSERQAGRLTDVAYAVQTMRTPRMYTAPTLKQASQIFRYEVARCRSGI